jgi:uncharacterized protein (DUF488 family)
MKLYTIGYGGRNPEEFVKLLKEKGIQAVVDVRLRPDKASLGTYVKSKDSNKGIQSLLAKVGIRYFSFVELGNPFMNFEDWTERYHCLMNRAGDLLIERLSQVPSPSCLMCAEKRASSCHRLIIAEYLATKGYQVEHIE